MPRYFSWGVVAWAVASSAVLVDPAGAAPLGRPVARDDRVVVLEDSLLRLPAPGVLANDDGAGRLRAALAREPGRAQARLDATGALRLRPAADVNGTLRLAYRAVDGAGRSDRAVVRVEVVPVNDAPLFVAGPDQEIASGAGPQVVPGWARGIDAGARNERGQELTFEVGDVSEPDLFAPAGLPAVAADGTLTYAPAPGARGTATARVTLRDDGGVDHGGRDTSASALLRIRVTAARTAPAVGAGAGAAVLDPGSSVPLVPQLELRDDDSLIAAARISIVGGAASGLSLAALPAPGLTIAHDGAGTLTLTGRASDAAYRDALRTVTVGATAAAAAGPRRVQIEVEDVDGLTGTAEREIRVRELPPPNRPTTTRPDTAVVDEDTEATGNVLANDTDPDDVLTVTGHADPAHGTLTIATNGDYRYTPDPNWNGTEPTITYTTNTGATGTLDITVTPVNDAPVARDDSFTTDEDTSVSGAVLVNDGDAEGDVLTAAVVAGPGHGTLVLDAATGAFVYSPEADFHGTDTFTYRSHDGTAASGLATVTLTVTPVNDAPVARADDATTAVGTEVTGDVLVNDTDVDADDLTAVLITGPANGTLTLDADGGFSYTPSAGFRGTDTFTYRADDGTTRSAPATVTITVVQPNRAPVARDDSVSTDEDDVATGDVLVNDSDEDGDDLTASLVTGPDHGALTLDADGTFTYTPDADFHGTDTFTYRAQDGSAASAPATVTLTVRPVNDAPVARDDSFTIDEDQPLQIPSPFTDLTGNDTDVDGDSLRIASIQAATNGTLNIVGTTLVFTPTQDYSGPASFRYTITDDHGGIATATAHITVIALNDPTVTRGDTVVTDEDTEATGNVLANDTDPDDVLTVTGHTDPAHGTLTIATDGDYRYTPDPNWNGTEPTITYTTNTGATGTLDITVTPVNDAPVAVDDHYTVDEDEPLVIALPLTELSANDTDVDGDTLTVYAVSSPVNGTIDVIGGDLVFTPTAEFSGTASFSYNIHDGHSGVSTATVHLTVTAVDDPTVTRGDTVVTDEDTDATGNVLANDTDPDDVLTVTGHTDPAHGTLTIATDGDYRYTPDPNWNGTEPTITYTTNTGATGTLDITVTPVNDAPVAVDDHYTVDEDEPLVIALPLTELSANDTDVDGDTLTVYAVSSPVNGTIDVIGGDLVFTPTAEFSGTASFSYNIHDGHSGVSTATVHLTVTAVDDPTVTRGDTVVTDEDTDATGNVLANDTDPDDVLTVTGHTDPAHGTLTIATDGDYRYTPDPNWNGTEPTITYTTNTGATGTLDITVTPVSDAPVAIGGSLTTDEDTPATGDACADDADPDGDRVTATIQSGVSHGSLLLNTVTCAFTYTPNRGFSGTDSFTIRVYDVHGAYDDAEITVTVRPVPDAPVARNDNVTTTEDTPATGNVLTNDTDEDGDTLTAILVTGPAHGTLTLNAGGTFTYTPSADFNGTDSFTYRAQDGSGRSSVATVTLTVTPVNDAPVAIGGSLTTDEDTPATGDACADDADPEGDRVTATIQSGVSHGSLLLNTVTCAFTYTPNRGFSGTDRFTIRVYDVHGAYDDAEITVTVRPIP